MASTAFVRRSILLPVKSTILSLCTCDCCDLWMCLCCWQVMNSHRDIRKFVSENPGPMGEIPWCLMPWLSNVVSSLPLLFGSVVFVVVKQVMNSHRDIRKFVSENPGPMGEISWSLMLLRCVSFTVQSLFVLLPSLSPRLIAGLLFFIDTSDMTIMKQEEHPFADQLAWDPSGRYVSTAVCRSAVRPCATSFIA